MRISVIGSGYVGLVSAACFAEIGHDVISVDNDGEKIAMLERGEVPIHERFLPELLARHRGGRLRFSTSVSEAVESSDVVFITVGTPQSETGEADLSFVEAVAQKIASAIRSQKRNLYQPDQKRSAGLIYKSIGRAVGIPEHTSTIAHHLEPAVRPLVPALACAAAAT